MISGGPISGDGRYWVDLAKVDYQTKSGEPLGRWGGSGATHFGLDGKVVGRDQLLNVLRGFDPNEDKKLVFNAGKDDRQRGHDFTFNAPKSVSLVWAASDEKTRQIIGQVHKEAVDRAIEYLEKNATFTRRGKGGTNFERAKLLVAKFEHSTSRAEDPHLHTHVLIPNVCVRYDGTTGTLFSKVTRDKSGNVTDRLNPLYRQKMAAGAIYRMALSHGLQNRAGFGICRGKNAFGFEIANVPISAIEYFSKRREAIEEALKEKGFASAKAAEIAALDTRIAKAEVERPKLFREWQTTLKTFGIDQSSISEFKEKCKPSSPERLTEVIRELSEKLSEGNGAFELNQLVQAAATELEKECVSFEDFEAALENELSNGKLVTLGEQNLNLVISTQKALSLEHEFVSLLNRAQHNEQHAIDTETVDRVLKTREAVEDFKLSEMQRDAIRFLTSKVDDQFASVRVLTGDAGSGKTTVMKTAKQVWETAGYKVFGASLSGKATDELEKKSGIESHTIAKWNYMQPKSSSELLIHHGKQLVRAVRGKETSKTKPVTRLDAKSVLVIDEAAMADTHQILPLIKRATNAGSLVVLVGDDKQCQAIGHGGGFVTAARTLNTFRLAENWRQLDARDIEIAKLFSEGKSEQALRNKAEQGHVNVSKSEKAAISALVNDWKKRGARSPSKHQIFVNTNDQRKAVNQKCQDARLGLVKRKLGVWLKNHEGQRLYLGDRVNFRETIICQQPKTLLSSKRNERIRRGEFGTIIGINLLTKSLTVRMDDRRILTVPIEMKQTIDRKIGWGKQTITCKSPIALGYATTTHAGQGGTFDYVYVLAGGQMQNRELTYVQFSRAKHFTKLYTSEQEAGPELTDLAKNNGKPSRKFSHKDSIRNSMLAGRMSSQRKKVFGLDKSVQHREELARTR